MSAEELGADVRHALAGLAEQTRTRVARHLAMAGRLLEEDPELAYAHALAARRRAARIGAVREACGVAAYAAGRFAEALTELRTASRLTGVADLLPMMVDCERALGHPERALALASGPEAGRLGGADRIELLIVTAGARRDLGQPAAAVRVLAAAARSVRGPGTAAARLRYAYADALEHAGQEAEAAEWFGKAMAADVENETNAEQRRAAVRGRAGRAAGEPH